MCGCTIVVRKLSRRGDAAIMYGLPVADTIEHDQGTGI